MAEQNEQELLPEYPVFKGLQKPLEFMGLQGRYIFWAAGAIGGAIVGFIAAYLLIGFVAGLIALSVIGGTGAAVIFVSQKKGLHSKRIDKGIFVYACSHRL